MSVIYYPNRVQKRVEPAIDRTMAKRNLQIINKRQNIVATAIDFEYSSSKNWQLDSIAFAFSNVNARNYSVKIKNGRKVLTDLNDYLWFQIDTTGPQRIILDTGFYTGTELAAELKAQMDANTAFAAQGVTFTVTYDSTTGIYTITPSSGTLKYFNVNSAQELRIKDSIAGHLFGLTADIGFAASVASCEAVSGLDSETALISEINDISLSRYNDDIHTLTIDQAVHIETNTANVIVDYSITYEELV
jgi:hypothetical protein